MKTNKKLNTLIVLLILAVSLFPFWIMLNVSLMNTSEAISSQPHILVQHPSLDNYINVFMSESSPWVKYFVNSFVVAMATATVSTLLAIFSGYSLARLSFIGKTTISNSFYVIYMFSGLLLLVPLYRIISSVGLYGTRTSLVLAMVVQTLPTAVFMMKSFYENIPEELEEAALVDGLNRFQVILKIIMPISINGIVSSFVYCAMIAWNDYLFASVFLKLPENFTIALGLNNLFSMPDKIWGEMMAVSLLTSVPIVVMYAISQRLINDDVTKGGIK
ncbi:MAG: carbohydrate ABC transporter permease [Lactovum sp.]